MRAALLRAASLVTLQANAGLDVSRAGRGTGPIADRRVINALKAITMKDILAGGEWNPRLRQEFIEGYVQWIQACSAARVTGLGEFPVRYFVNGVTQSYDIFFLEHKGRRFRTLKGEYPYVRLSVPQWAHVEDDELRANDALVLSCPFYGDGGVPRGFRSLLDRCGELGIPVLLDAAYFGTCYDVSFDYSHPAIEMLSFSLSKPFSVQSFRIGMLLMKRPLPYLEEIQVQARYYNRVGAYVGLRLMRDFPADFLATGYRQAHQKVCQELGVIPSHCLMLANIRDEDRRFDKILEDKRFEDSDLPQGVLRRICVSNYLTHDGSPVRRLAKKLLGR